jgi:2-iminobutanoate/2-iminopropanoate deaminase
MKKTVVFASQAPAPVGPYSQAVRSGELLFCAGQIPLDPKSGEIVAGGIEEQTRRVLENLGAVLAEAGSGFEHVLKTTIFLADLGDFAAMNGVYAGYFPSEPPARSTVQAAALPKNARVEIDAIARVP